MSQKPKVSICIPSYNHARFLPAALESALNQTYQNIEVIVVDDGSTDSSLQIATDYAARHPLRVSVFTHPDQRNRGISATVNLGFEKSTGVYYSGLPSDDVLRTDKIEKQVALLESHPEIDFVYSQARHIDETGQELPNIIGNDVTQDSHPAESMLSGNVIPGTTVLARRECIERNGPHDESLIYSDWDFWTRLISNCKAGFIPEPLVHYRVHSYNTSVGIKPELDLQYSLEVMLALRAKASGAGEIGQPRFRASLDRKIAMLRGQLARTLLDNYHELAQSGQLSRAIPFLLKAAQIAPTEVLYPRRLVAVLKNGILGAVTRTPRERARLL